MQVRDKLRQRQQNKTRKVVPNQVTYDADQILAKHHDNEFKKWHINVALIIAAVLAGTCFIILKSPWLFYWLSK